jgi:muramoyltetrapeptide carboxypeptidase
VKPALIKPPRPGSRATVGVVSLSAPVAAQCPRRFERACNALETLGYGVRVSTHAKLQSRYMAGRPRLECLVRLLDSP